MMIYLKLKDETEPDPPEDPKPDGGSEN